MPITKAPLESKNRWRSLAIAALLLVCFRFLGCTQGENSVVNPGSNRTGLTALPETLQAGEATADRAFRAEVATGGLSTLLLANVPDSIETIVYLRFGTLPDTANLTEARLGLRLQGGSGTGLHLEAYPVAASAPAWTETSLFWTNQPPLDSQALDVAGSIDAPGDTIILLRDAVRIPVDLIRRWKRLPDTNRGIALRLTGSSIGSLPVLSREAVLDSANIANPVLEFLEGTAVVATQSPTEDAYVYHDPRPAASGADSLLRITETLPNRALLRFRLPSAIPAGSTINRAVVKMHLFGSAPADTMELGAYSFSTSNGLPWDEGAEPDSIGLLSIYDQVLLPDDIVEPDRTVSFEIAHLAQRWFTGSDTLGVLIRGLGELVVRHQAVFYSREAADPALRPVLEVVFTRPPDPRWGSGQGGVR